MPPDNHAENSRQYFLSNTSNVKGRYVDCTKRLRSGCLYDGPALEVQAASERTRTGSRCGSFNQVSLAAQVGEASKLTACKPNYMVASASRDSLFFLGFDIRWNGAGRGVNHACGIKLSPTFSIRSSNGFYRTSWHWNTNLFYINFHGLIPRGHQKSTLSQVYGIPDHW
ncbi:hypothetical protein BD779DRAFT_1466656 [Infundibulicybe gibba]|nr:hypothetical protein BD779DRAFT_1466656 [Infundibulicybe gibba]